ncbi:MAG: substrate-binding domain-containing protein [Alphaproteobacteria bacterium]|nr:substrate-binding domain-containing protein [Alphaproteobacteria bacterium]
MTPRASLLAALLLACWTINARADELRVCADPNNLPFSNAALQGFENKIAALIAQDLKDQVSYTWWAQRRGFVRNTLRAQQCDLWPGIASKVDLVAATRPYYRSTYVFVTRADRGLDISSFDDPRLRTLTIGVQMIGNDAMNTPPAHALADRGITDNVRGYMLYGDYSRPNPPAAIIDAVARGDIDIAVVWGPLAGYFAAQQPAPLSITPVAEAADGAWPMQFDISMGVRKGDVALKRAVDAALDRNRGAIEALLAAYHVPRLPEPAAIGHSDPTPNP